jgi:hypothetical protein
LARPSLHICAMATQSRRADGCSSAHSRHTSALLPDVRSPHSECNFANKSVFAPVQANFPVLLGDHLFDDTATNSPSRRFLHGWTARLSSVDTIDRRPLATIPGRLGRWAWTKHRTSRRWSPTRATLPQLPERRLVLTEFAVRL